MKKKFELKHGVDLAVIMISVFALIFVFGFTQPLVIAPLDNAETFETEVLFSIEKADKLLIDDNLDFTTPEEYTVEDGLKINLKPGKYYWKVIGVTSSEVRTLTVNSKVSLEFVGSEGNYSVVNVGNLRLSVDIYNGTKLVGQKKLEANEVTKINGNKVIGEQDYE